MQIGPSKVFDCGLNTPLGEFCQNEKWKIWLDWMYPWNINYNKAGQKSRSEERYHWKISNGNDIWCLKVSQKIMEIILKEYLWSKAYSEPCQISRMEFFARIVSSILATKVYLRCFRGFWIRLWSEINRHFLITYVFSVSLKFGACSISTVCGGEFRIKNTLLEGTFLFLFTMKFVFLSFSFLFMVKFQISATEY